MEAAAQQFLLRCNRIRFLLGRGEAVVQSRQNLPFFVHFQINPPQAVDNAVLSISKNQV